MTCQELVELVTEYLEGTLAHADTMRFEEHIAHCQFCSRYLEQMRMTITTIGRVEVEAISPEARATLLAAFGDWHAERH
jgi:predicted anti-sigma-YlaC factor YlaD